MFTGIIEELGTVENTSSARLEIKASVIAADSALGDSVAVNRVCLTISKKSTDVLAFDVMERTRAVSGLGSLKKGDSVNCERAARPSTFLGGHIVQGHVDGTGTVRSIKKENNSTALTIAAPADLLNGMIEKGAVAVDGISLTIAELSSDSFTISLIPTTLESTTLGSKKAGDIVNIETDVLGKYVKKYVQAAGSGSVTEDLLKRTGFM